MTPTTPAIAVETEYALAPGVRALRITSTLTNEGKKALDKFAIGDAVDWGRAERFVPHKGLDAVGARQHRRRLRRRASATTRPTPTRSPKGRSTRATTGSGATSTRSVVDLPPGASVKVVRWLVVGAPTDTSLYESLATLRKARWGRLSGRILEEATGESLAGAHVYLDDCEGPVAMTRSTAQGYALLGAVGRLSRARRGHRPQRAVGARGHRRRRRRRVARRAHVASAARSPTTCARTARRCRRG